jgi:hypothetical protein
MPKTITNKVADSQRIRFIFLMKKRNRAPAAQIQKAKTD